MGSHQRRHLAVHQMQRLKLIGSMTYDDLLQFLQGLKSKLVLTVVKRAELVNLGHSPEESGNVLVLQVVGLKNKITHIVRIGAKCSSYRNAQSSV